MYSKVIQLYMCVCESILYLYSFSDYFSILGYYKILHIILCAIQQVLVVYLFYILSMYLLIVAPNYPLPTLSFLVTLTLFSASVTVFLFCKQVHLYHYFRFHVYHTEWSKLDREKQLSYDITYV